MPSFAPWYYRNLLTPNDLVKTIEYYTFESLDGKKQYEVNVFLQNDVRPSWLNISSLYKNCDGTGTSTYKNVAAYKAISESLERLAFYEAIENRSKEFSFDLNPTTTGMAAFPHWSSNKARENAKLEAVERWAIHQFNKFNIPICTHFCSIKNVLHYELAIYFDKIHVSLLVYKHEHFYTYSFAAGFSIEKSFERALVELNRNISVLAKVPREMNLVNLQSATDKTLFYYSSEEGFTNFQKILQKSPTRETNLYPKIICDKEIVGHWSKYAKVWRYLLEDSYFDCSSDHRYFMF